MAQQPSLSSSEPTIKILVSDAITAIDNRNTTKAFQNLNIVNQILGEIKENSTSIQTTKLLLQDAVRALQDGETSRASVYLNLVGQQFGIQQPNTETSNAANINNASKSINLDSLTYEHPILDITIHYTPDWQVRQYEYSPEANNTLAGFYSPSKTASELGNISGVSGHFVPYADLYVFDSNNFTLDEIVDQRLKRLQNDTHFTNIESKPFSLDDKQQPAQLLTYKTIAGGDELFKKMQVYTIYNNTVYLISFTSQDALFTNYLPTVQKMMKSFEIGNENATIMD